MIGGAMPWQLIILNGTQAGRSLTLKERDSLVVGRGTHCDLYVADKGVSRTHCYIWEKDGEIWIKDTESANGTIVNEKEIKEQRLNIGDMIKFGNTILEVRGTGVEYKEQKFNTSRRRANTILLRRNKEEPAFSLEVAQGLRVKRDIALLHRIGKILQTELDIPKLCILLLETLITELSIEKGHIFLKPLTEENDTVSFFRVYVPAQKICLDQIFLAHRSILNLAIFKSEATVSSNPLLEDIVETLNAPSNLHSILCVPIEGQKSPLGAIYLDSGTNRKFDKEDLDFISAIGNQLGLSLERLIREQKNITSEKESWQIWNSIVQNFRDVLYRQENNKNFLFISPSIEKLTGYTREEFSQHWEEIIVPEDKEHVWENRQKAFLGEDIQMEYRMIRKNGEIFLAQDTFYPIRDGKDSSISCIQGILKEIKN